MKPFNLELAKAGHPVCTRDGRDARIICFDKKPEGLPIIALVSNGTNELLVSFRLNGTYFNECESNLDLMMKSTKKEGWINIYKNCGITRTSMSIDKTREEAIKYSAVDGYVDTIKIEWEE